MKQTLYLTLFIMVLLVPYDACAAAGTGVALQGTAASGESEQPPKRRFQRFVDEDGDGLNDLVSDSDCDGLPNGKGPGYGRHRFGAGSALPGAGMMRGKGQGMGSGSGRGGGR